MGAGEQLKAVLEAANKGTSVRKLCSPEIADTIITGQDAWREAYSDVQWVLDEVIEQGERVAFRYTTSAVSKETKKKMTWTGSGVAHVTNGKFSRLKLNEDHWGRLIAEGKTPLTPEDDITGTWNGSLWGVAFVLQLQQSPPSTAVSGSVSGLGMSLPLTGTNTPPSVLLAGSSPKGPVTFSGNWKGDNEIDATINGAGFDNQPITITR